MSEHVEPKSYNTATHDEKGITQVEDSSNLDHNAKASDYKAAAIEAENAEHNMSVPEAVRQYPMAALWAFVMCCTIVRRHRSRGVLVANKFRSWSPTVSS